MNEEKEEEKMERNFLKFLYEIIDFFAERRQILIYEHIQKYKYICTLLNYIAVYISVCMCVSECKYFWVCILNVYIHIYILHHVSYFLLNVVLENLILMKNKQRNILIFQKDKLWPIFKYIFKLYLKNLVSAKILSVGLCCRVLVRLKDEKNVTITMIVTDKLLLKFCGFKPTQTFL